MSPRRLGDEGEPLEGSLAVDDSGHQWKRSKNDGWWRCMNCEDRTYPHTVMWSWRDVLADASGTLRISTRVL